MIVPEAQVVNTELAIGQYNYSETFEAKFWGQLHCFLQIFCL